MKKSFRIAETALDIIITVLLLSIFKIVGLINVKENMSDMIFYALPLIVSVIRNFNAVKKTIYSLIVRVKSVFSSQSVFWEFVGEYVSDEEINIQRILENMDLNECSKYYKSINKDIQNSNRALFNMDGLRFDIKTSSMGEHYECMVTFSADSPLRSYRNKHEKYVIKPFLTKLERNDNSLSLQKYSINASKILIHEEITNGILSDDLEKDYDIIALKATYKKKDDENTVITINGNNFVCISDKLKVCCEAFRFYVFSQS